MEVIAAFFPNQDRAHRFPRAFSEAPTLCSCLERNILLRPALVKSAAIGRHINISLRCKIVGTLLEAPE
jgi:hypothetical protein